MSWLVIPLEYVAGLSNIHAATESELEIMSDFCILTIPPKYKSPPIPAPPVTTSTPVLVDVAAVLTGLIVTAIEEFVIVVSAAATTNFIAVPVVMVARTRSP